MGRRRRIKFAVRYLKHLVVPSSSKHWPQSCIFPLSFPCRSSAGFDLGIGVISSNPGIGVVLDGGNEDTTEAQAAAKESLSSRRLRFPCVRPGTSAPERTPSVYISVFSSAPLGSACCPRRPVSRSTPLVDEGPVLTSPVFDLVLVIGTVLALSLTDICTVLDTSVSLCSSCFALVF